MGGNQETRAAQERDGDAAPHEPGRYRSVEERLEAEVDAAARALMAGRERGDGAEELRLLRQLLLNASDRLRRHMEERP